MPLLAGARRLVVCVAPHKKGPFYRSTYLDTAKAVANVLARGSAIEHLVYTSSTSVYGDHKGAWVTETSPLLPMETSSEILCQTEAVYLHKVPSATRVTILRLGGLFGPDRTLSSRMQGFASQGALPGSGQEYCNLVHRDDCVRAIDWVFSQNLTGVYNVCSAAHPTRKSLYTAIAQQLGIPPITWNPNTPSPHVGNKRVSNEKLCASGFVFLENFYPLMLP